MRPDFFFLAAPDDVMSTWMNREYFALMRSNIEVTTPESDLFAGVALDDTRT